MEPLIEQATKQVSDQMTGLTGLTRLTGQMTKQAGPSVPEIPEDALEAALFAWEWARMLIGTSFVVADRTLVADQLRALTLRLVATLEHDPFAPDDGIAIGQRLVELGFASADALAHTTTLINRRFLTDLGLDAARERLDQVVGKICLGFVRAIRDRTLEQQDAIRSSALMALERTRASQRAQALQDDVTGLLNRRGFTAALDRLIEAHPRGIVGIGLLSLGGFEALDRGLGRNIGDQILKTVAERLTTRFAGQHELLARLDRDEFLVAAIDGHNGTTGSDPLADRLEAAQAAVQESITVGGTPVVLSTSFGVVARPAPDTDPATILRDADLAASWARSRGPGSISFFDADKAADQIAEIGLTAQIPAALERGQLRPFYQPIVSLQTGRTEVVEALARWSHPDGGLLAPKAFLHLAGRGGLMSLLGRTMLRHACQQGREWERTLGQPPVIAVNVSRSQLTDPETVRDLVTILEETGLPAGQLQLEISEHAALDDPATLRTIRDLTRVGVGLALDDFGTGLAHLAHLAALPAHGVRTLKLPAEFLRPAGGVDVAHDAARSHILSAIINLAHDLGMWVTVEGVETPGHDALIRELGADLAQGSFYSPPETAEKVGRRLGARRAM